MGNTSTSNDIFYTRPSVDEGGFAEPKELDPLLDLLIADKNIQDQLNSVRRNKCLH